MCGAVRVQKKINDVGWGAVRRNFFKELWGTVWCGNTFFEKNWKNAKKFSQIFSAIKVRVRWRFFNRSAPHPTRTLKIPKIPHRTPHPHVRIGAAVCACAEMLFTRKNPSIAFNYMNFHFFTQFWPFPHFFPHYHKKNSTISKNTLATLC